MIVRIIDEIKACFNNNCCLAGLTTALTLPDICGKAEYKNIYTGKNSGDICNRYIKWVNKYITPKSLNIDKNIPYLDGELLWNLRNHTIHELSYNICGNKQKIKDCELLIQDVNGATLTSGASVKTVENSQNTSYTEKYLCINVVELCLKICYAALKYYKENTNKFNFMKNKLTTVNKNSKNLLLSHKDLDYCSIFKLSDTEKLTKWDVFFNNLLIYCFSTFSKYFSGSLMPK